MPPDVPAFPFIELKEVFNILQNEDHIPWAYFRDGVDIHRFYGDGETGPSAALIRFRKEARVPMHMHTGWEHILVLSGSQRDQNGIIGPGTSPHPRPRHLPQRRQRGRVHRPRRV